MPNVRGPAESVCLASTGRRMLKLKQRLANTTIIPRITSTPRECFANERPSRMPRIIVGRARRASGNISEGRIITRLVRTARNDTAFAAKHQPTPTAAITRPPIAGPTTRPRLKIVELSATAFESSSRPIHLERHALSRRRVEDERRSRQRGDDVDVPRGRMTGQHVDREQRAEHHLHRLGHDHGLAVVEPVGDHTGTSARTR